MLKKLTTIIILAMVAAVLWLGCENDYPDSPFKWTYDSKPTPVITNIDPATGSYGGVGRITVTGQNFSLIPSENHVFFNGQEGRVLAATTTTLDIQTATVVGDSVKVQMRVDGAYELFTYPTRYKLLTAVHEYKAITEYTPAYALAVDKDENLYSFISYLTTGKVVKFGTPDTNDFTTHGTVTFGVCTGMKVGPGGVIYLLRGNTFVYKIPAGGGASAQFVRLKDRVNDLDFDQNGNMFVGGVGKAIIRLKQNADSMTVAKYADNQIKALRVYNNNLYVVTKYTGTDTTAVQEGILVHPILDADGKLGPAELVYNWKAYAGKTGPSINTITFDANGMIYAGLDFGNAVMRINLTTGDVTPFYPEVLTPPSTYFAWGNGSFLYINRFNSLDPKLSKILRVAMQVNGAPTYGRDF